MSLPELQSLLDEWIVACRQTRSHDSLRDPDAPARAFSPNEKYTTLLESCGYVPVPLSGEDYVELLPERWQAINAYGIRIKHRTFSTDKFVAFHRSPRIYNAFFPRETIPPPRQPDEADPESRWSPFHPYYHC